MCVPNREHQGRAVSVLSTNILLLGEMRDCSLKQVAEKTGVVQGHCSKDGIEILC